MLQNTINLALTKKIFYRYLLPTLIGIVLPFSFAPYNIYPLAILFPALLLFLWERNTEQNTILKCARESAIQGFFFGLGFFGFGVYWVYISLYVYGHAASALAFCITALLIIFLALFPATQGYILTKFFQKNNLRKLLLAFPATWTLLELLRTYIFTGFPWLLLGYSQIDSPLRGFAPIIGVYGISFFITLSAGIIVALVTKWKSNKNTINIALIATLLFIWLSGFLLAKIQWTKPTGNEVTVSLIQANISQNEKWNEKLLPSILSHYATLTKNNLNSSIIVWPEDAIPTFPEDVQTYLDNLDKAAKQHKSTVILGIPFVITNQSEHGNEEVYYNSIISIGNDKNIYLKRHLVPFGEFIPLKFLVKFFANYITIPMSDFSPGPKIQPDFKANNISLAPFICYEIAYPELVLSHLPQAELLLTISDDSWFDKSIALAQHLEIARMRSLETGRYQLVNANTGLTAIIDPFGKIIAQAPPFEEFVLNGKIHAMIGATFWVTFGHYLLIIFAAACLLAATL